MIKIFGATDKNYTSNGDIVLQRDTKIAEWNDYNNYCEACKQEAKRLLGLEE